MTEKLNQMIMRTKSHEPPTQAEIDGCYTAHVDELLSRLRRAREMEDSSIYSNLETEVDELRADLRESVQAATRKPMWEIIKKLRVGGALGARELELVRLWVVGDADAYVKEENNYGDWLKELDRLGAKIESLRQGPPSVERLESLRGLLTDARGVTRSIALYLNDRERVQRFESTLAGGLDQAVRDTLADILARSYHDPLV
jgi:hypothetical protein